MISSLFAYSLILKYNINLIQSLQLDLHICGISTDCISHVKFSIKSFS